MKKLWFCLTILMVAAGTMAQSAQPYNLSLMPDMAIHNRDTTIEGVTLSVWGENPQTSLALGFINGTTGHSVGFSWSVFVNYSDSYQGVEWGMINYSQQDSVGWDAGFLAYTKNSLTGLGTAVVNYAGRLNGLQLGLLNYAEDTDTGVQVGLINIINSNKGWFSDMPNSLAPVMLFVNWRK